MVESTTITLPKPLKDRLAERGTVDDTYADVIEQLLDQTQNSR